MKRPIHCAVLSLLMAAPLLAQELMPATNEFLVNQQVSGSQSLPHVASDEAGGYVVVWTENANVIKARRYGADHQPVTDEIPVAASGSMAKVYYWSEGRYLITWQGNPSGSRVLAADNTLGDVNATMGGAGDNIDMDINDDVAIVAYVAAQHIYIRKWDLNTNSWIGDHMQVSEIPSNNYILPQVRWTNMGNIVVVYANGSGTRRIYRKTFNEDLLAQIPEEILYTTSGTVGVVNISINTQDELLIYARFGVNGIDVFWGSVMDADGNEIMANVGSMSAPYAYYYTDCELFDNGKVVLTNNYKTALNDPEEYNVRVNYGSFPGSANSTGFLAASNTVSGEQRFPSVTRLPNGGFVMAWNGNGFQGDNDGVYARAFHAATFPGLMTTTASPIMVDETGATGNLGLRLGSQPTGNVLVDLAVSNAAEAMIGLAQVTFTADDWDQVQSITVTGVDDAEDDGDITLHITATLNAATADPVYAAMPPQQYAVVNRDDDATFTMPEERSFCRSSGIADVVVVVTNNGDTLGTPSASSSDQAVVPDEAISVVQVNTSTFHVNIAPVPELEPGTTTITLGFTDGSFTYSDSFNVVTLGSVPVIAWVDMELVSTSGTAYQWYLDGQAIDGATGQTWTPAANGNYIVEVTDVDGCLNTSVPYFFSTTGVLPGVAPAVNAYPLPADERFFITGVRPGTNYQLFDAQGRIVAEGTLRLAQQTIDTGHLATGLHVLVLENGNRIPVVVEH